MAKNIALALENLGKAAFLLAPPHLHLPQAVLAHDVALRKEEIVDVAGVDVRDTPAVADDVNGLAQARDVERAVELRERLPRKRLEIATGRCGVRRVLGVTDGDEQREHRRADDEGAVGWSHGERDYTSRSVHPLCASSLAPREQARLPGRQNSRTPRINRDSVPNRVEWLPIKSDIAVARLPGTTLEKSSPSAVWLQFLRSRFNRCNSVLDRVESIHRNSVLDRVESIRVKPLSSHIIRRLKPSICSTNPGCIRSASAIELFNSERNLRGPAPTARHCSNSARSRHDRRIR